MSGIVLNSLQDKSIREEKKPKHIVKMETAFYDIIGTRNQWTIQELHDYIKSPNTIYWNSDPASQLPISITKTINIPVIANKIVYPAMIGHLDYDEDERWKCNFREVGIVIPNDSNLVVEIQVNTRTIGYYIPSLNSFIFGNLAWHEQYITVLMKELWPRILEKLNIH